MVSPAEIEVVLSVMFEPATGATSAWALELLSLGPAMMGRLGFSAAGVGVVWLRVVWGTGEMRLPVGWDE